MTKALYCGLCGTIRTFHANGDVTKCDCGALAGWWVDAVAGVARLYASNPALRDTGRIIGFNNRFLSAASAEPVPYPDGRPLGQSDIDAQHRLYHGAATAAPGYLFDKSRRDCWAIVIAPAQSNDTRWASDAEWQAKHNARPVARTSPGIA